MAARNWSWERKVKSVLRLNAELHELPDDPAVRLRHLAESVCTLLGARAAVVGRWEGGATGGPRALNQMTTVGLDESDLRLVADYFRNGRPLDPTEDAMFRLPSRRLIVRRGDLLSDRDWYGSAHFDEVRRPIRVDNHLYMLARTVPGHADSVGIHRPAGDKPFSERERLLADLLHCSIQWIYQAWPSRAIPTAHPAVAALPPRLRRVLDGLLAGQAEKQIAAAHRLSRHTVHEYAKMLYQRLGVNSRGELFALLASDSSHRPPEGAHYGRRGAGGTG